MLIVQEDGTPKHILPVQYVDSVPSKRAVELAYSRIVDCLTDYIPHRELSEIEADIKTVKGFICSR